MNQTIIILLLSLFVFQNSEAQIKWSKDSIPPDQIKWGNYSTTFIGDVSDSIPFIVTAIPYNGTYSNFSDINTAVDMSFEGSLFRFKGNILNNSQKLYTYDSSEVYFLTPGIYKANAAEYEYRVILNAKTILTPWSTVNNFSDIQLNTFNKGFGYLGGYRAKWDEYIVVELRKRNGNTISSTIVYWKEIKPVVSSIYTTKNLNEFFSLLKRPWDGSNTKSTTSLANPRFSSAESIIIFQLSADIYKKEALEYQLTKDGETQIKWKANDFDNSFIWLQDLKPGKYVLEIRFSKQRQNISSYKFEITPAWHQTSAFKLTAGSLIAAFFGFIAVLFRLRIVRKRMEAERLSKDRSQLELRTIYSQLNPHFVFNCLSSIQGLINKNDLAAANRYLSEFSVLLRYSLSSAERDFNNLDLEMAAMEKYLKLEQLRFNFGYTIQKDDGINASEIKIPALLLQPILENAIKHGIGGMYANGSIQLDFRRENKDMVVTIQDNGRGFPADRLFTGHGTKLTLERIKLLNEILADKTIELTKLENVTSGTVMHVRFKNWLYEN